MKPYYLEVGIEPCDTDTPSMEDMTDRNFKQVKKIREEVKTERRYEKKRTRQAMKNDLKDQVDQAGY